MHSTDIKIISTGSFRGDVALASKSSRPCVVKVPRNASWFKEFRDRVPVILRDVDVSAYSKSGDKWDGKFHELWKKTMETPEPSDIYMTDVTLGLLPGQLVKQVPVELRALNVLRYLEPYEQPDWNWYMVGGSGTSSPRHVDTGASSAWNVLLKGRKQWGFGNRRVAFNERRVPPAVFELESSETHIEYVQMPGDILFTPAGWVHEVYNIEASAALTGNFINSANVEAAERFWQALNDEGKARLIAEVRHHV